MKETLLGIIEKFKGKKILVIGDVMLDKYVWGEVTRISPEAPVQIVKATRESYAPGGAANVANNVAALGGKVELVGFSGDDEARKKLIGELGRIGISTRGVFIDNKRPTIQKVRIIGKSQQLLRVDYEDNNNINKEVEKKIIDYVSGNIDKVEGVIISDYAKGIITEKTAAMIIGLCNEKRKIVVADPKPQNKNFYKNTTVITPNHIEAHQMAGITGKENTNEETEKIGKVLSEELSSPVLITRGEKGMSLIENDEITHIPTYAKEVYDIVGAGDTSAATLTLALASGASLKEAAIIANHAAGITVGKIGTSTVSVEDLRKSIEDE